MSIYFVPANNGAHAPFDVSIIKNLTIDVHGLRALKKTEIDDKNDRTGYGVTKFVVKDEYDNHCWFYTNDDGSMVTNATQFGLNDTDYILERVGEEANVYWVSEHDEEFDDIVGSADEENDPGYVTFSINELDELASEIITIDPVTGIATTIKKDGKLVQ